MFDLWGAVGDGFAENGGVGHPRGIFAKSCQKGVKDDDCFDRIFIKVIIFL